MTHSKGDGEPAMKAAFAIWDERIAPVFDVARSVRVVEAEAGRVVRSETVGVPAAEAPGKAQWLVSKGISVLVCGAISRPLCATIAAHGIEVIPFVAGGVHDVESAWLAGTLRQEPFAMPGCWGRGLGFRSRGGAGREGGFMQGRNRGGGMGGGGGGGGMNRRGARGGGMGRMGGGSASGPGGACVCPSCGYRETHERGIPCNQKRCAKCGAMLTRE